MCFRALGQRRWWHSLFVTALLFLTTFSLVSPARTKGPLTPLAAASQNLPFKPPIYLETFSGDSSTWEVALGDLNSDGALDLVLVNGAEPSQVYLNDGDGRFTSTFTLLNPNGTSASEVSVGDLDSDGALDLVLGNEDELQVYLNDGEGNFTPTAIPLNPTGSDTSDLAAGDMNGDGSLDLVLGNFRQPSEVYLNNGKGQFTLAPIQINPPGSATTSVVVGDFNGDGSIDLVLGNISAQQSQVYLNNGRGQFTNVPLPDSVGGNTSLAVGDLDGDGALDLVLGNTYQSLVYLNDGKGQFLTPTQLNPNRYSASASYVAVGDLDNDGALDIVLGNNDEPSQVYLNDGRGQFTPATTPLNPTGNDTYDIEVGDLNGDGALDLVMGNNEEPSLLYLNDSRNQFIYTPMLLNPDGSTANDVAMGDMDGDGYLDVVLGNSFQPSRVYLNKGPGEFTSTPIDSTGSATTSVAVGDLDGDGDLDLVLGNFFQPSRVYLNNGDGLFKSAQIDSTGSATTSVAVGDLDGDGDLDLVLGNGTNPGDAKWESKVYLNNGEGQFTPTATTLNPQRNKTFDVAVGDLNGDGALDFVLGNYEEPSQVYLNNGEGQFNPTATTLNPEGNKTFSVAVGDLNGDGALDLVLGNYEQPSQVYLNNGEGQFTPTTPLNPTGSDTNDVALGDLNGDGALDLVLANVSYRVSQRKRPSQVYLNDGTGQFTPTASPLNPDGSQTVSVALGDLNGDGTLDLVLANNPAMSDQREPSQIYLNGTGLRKGLPNNPPRVTVGRPGPTANANFYSTPAILSSRVVSIPYTLFDPESDPVHEVRAEYSLNGGGLWQPALAATGTITQNLAASPSGVPYIFKWDIFASGMFGRSDNVVVRIKAFSFGKEVVQPSSDISFGANSLFLPFISKGRGFVSGPYQYGPASATTFPFRVRGTQVRVVDNAGLPQAGAIVYRIRGSQTAAPLAGLSGQPFRTDPQGYLGGYGEIAVDDQLVALQLITSTSTYTVYNTNATPTLTGLDNMYRVRGSGVQTLTVSTDTQGLPEHPLVLFNLKLSLEWDARADAQFLNQLRFDLQRVSDLLYDWSNGQAALGDVTVYQAKQHWDDADVRIYASNRLRPNADISGLGQSGNHIRMGAVWTRYGDPGGTLGEDWPRALAHELGHYLFGLEDNYLGLDEQNRLIPVDTCPGVMSDPYREDLSEFRASIDWLPACEHTLAHKETGQSDWENIVSAFEWLKQPVLPTPTFDPANAGPNSLPLAVTQVHFVNPVTPSTTLAAPIFYLTQGSARVLPGDSARAFLFICADGHVVEGVCQKDQWGNPQWGNLVDLGQPTLDQMLARGAHVGDRLCVYESVANRLGCEDIRANDTTLELKTNSAWKPNIEITPISSQSINVQVRNSVGLTLTAQLYPANGAPLAVQELTIDNGYATTFSLPEGIINGSVHIWVDEAEPRRESVADFGLGGSGVKLGFRGGAPVLSPDGQVMLYIPNQSESLEQVYTLQATTHAAPTPAWATVIGQPYRLTAIDEAALAGGSLNFSYLGRDVPPGEERWVTVYYCPLICPDDGSGWRPVTTLPPDTTNNQAIAAVQGAGLYALMSSVEIPLAAGDNIVAYPVQISRSVEEATASISDADPQVSRYNAETGGWQLLGENDMLEFGKGYKITVTKESTWRLKGSGSGQTANARTAAANGMVTYTGTIGSDATWTPPVGRPLVAYVNGQRCGQGGTVSDGQRVTYVITVVAESSIPGCGAPGRRVSFVIDGRVLASTVPWTTQRMITTPLYP